MKNGLKNELKRLIEKVKNANAECLVFAGIAACIILIMLLSGCNLNKTPAPQPTGCDVEVMKLEKAMSMNCKIRQLEAL